LILAEIKTNNKLDFFNMIIQKLLVLGMVFVGFCFPINADSKEHDFSFASSNLEDDPTQPTITIDAQNLILECDSSNTQSQINGWLLNNGGATSNTNPNYIWTHDYIVGSETTGCGTTGSVVVNFTVTADCGSTNTTQALIIINDTTKPEILLQAVDETVECDGLGNFTAIDSWLTINGGAIVADDCSNVTWSNNYIDLSDECSETGETHVIFTATDDCGNFTTTSAIFKIADTMPPTLISQSENLYIDGSDDCQTLINAWLSENGGAIAEDICSSSYITWSHVLQVVLHLIIINGAMA